MNKYKITEKIEQFAPLETQENWDVSGWIIDLPDKEITKVLFALTITDSIYEQAIKLKCDMIISHHPLFYVPLKYRDSNINMYCVHTNMDKALGGTTDTLLKQLGLDGELYNDFVRVVTFDNGIDVNSFIKKLKTISPNLRVVNNFNTKTIYKVAFCAGSGSEFISSTDCDAYVTGDIKFHTATEADKILIDIGHFESEIFIVEVLKKITGLSTNGVIADEKSPFN